MDEQPPPEPSLPLAGLGRRLGALLYEALLLLAIVFVVSFLALPFVSPSRATTAQALTVPAVYGRVALFCILFGGLAWYFVWSWTGGRRTLPMKTWRLRIVATDGQAPPHKAALLRYLTAWIGPVLALAIYAVLVRAGLGAHALWVVAFNFLWAIVDRERQFLHDRLAGTRIVLQARDAAPTIAAAGTLNS